MKAKDLGNQASDKLAQKANEMLEKGVDAITRKKA